MASRTRLPLHSLVVVLVVLGLGVAWLDQPRPAEAASANLPAWTGGVNLYRNGTFTTQKSWLWCTAAGVQIVRNIVDREDRPQHGQPASLLQLDARAQPLRPAAVRGRRSGRLDRRPAPLRRRPLPAGRRAGRFDSALRSAVKRLRLTNLPVALTVSHGNHGWILTGFRATADPAVTTSFRVTSVRVTGPLYGLQSKNGYDMAPNTKLTTAQLKRFFTPWKYAPKAMIWDGRYVSIQPVPKAAPAAAAAVPTPSRAASASPSPVASPTPRSVVESESCRDARACRRPRSPRPSRVAARAQGAGAATGAVSSTGEGLLPLWILLAGVTGDLRGRAGRRTSETASDVALRPTAASVGCTSRGGARRGLARSRAPGRRWRRASGSRPAGRAARPRPSPARRRG